MDASRSERVVTPSAAWARGAGAPMFALVSGLFFLSGSAGLVYQVLWMRALGLFLGSDIYGVSIILSTFMGGLALGSLVGGRLAERTDRPLALYGAAEVGIGLFALGFPALLDSIGPWLALVYDPASDRLSPAFHLLRVAVSSGALLVPTTLMGATLPLILRHFVRARSVLGGLSAFFYAINTLGALVGTLAAGFVLLPYLGMTAATLCAAVINLSIGVACLLIGFRSPLPPAVAAASGTASPELDTLPNVERSQRQRMARAAVVAIGLSGFGSFALEVLWTRILLITFSATVYSFASMLACFLFGIFLGSLLVSRLVDRHDDPLRLFAGLELGVGASVGTLCLLIHAVPEVFSGLLATLASLPFPGENRALVLSTLVTSLLLLTVPATLLGATFSVGLRVYTTNYTQIGSRAGNFYFSNTFGAVLGSLVGGLVLIPTIGAKLGLSLLALLFTGVGIYLAAVSSGARVFQRPAFALPVLVSLAAALGALFIPYRVTLNFNQNAGAETELLYHSEGIQNTIDVVRSRSGVTSLIIGGNVEADDGYTQRRHFVLKSHLPLMFLDPPISVLMVGLGMGITLESTASHPGVQRIDVIELSPEILEAQRVLGELNGHVVSDPRVRVRIDDGRSYMRMADQKYDMITADPIHPKISRVGYLYTREYYESIRDRLREGGVVCQWMPLYQISPRRLRSAMKTFADVFPHATFWYVQNHGLFVAKLDSPEIDYRRLERKFDQPSIRNDLMSIGVKSPEELLSLLLMGPEEIEAFVNAEPVPVNTDDYPYLEYFAPGDLFFRPAENVRAILPHLTDPTRFVRNQPQPSARRVRELIKGRGERLLSELEAPGDRVRTQRGVTRNLSAAPGPQREHPDRDPRARTPAAQPVDGTQ